MNKEKENMKDFLSKKEAIELTSKLYGLTEMAATVFIDKYIDCLSTPLIGNSIVPRDSIEKFFSNLTSKINRADNKFKDPLGKDVIFDLLNGFNKLVLGGSVMAGLSKTSTTSLGNCFVVGIEHDSYNAILQTEEHMVNILKRRGGVGLDLSHIRASGSVINNAAEESSGIVPFATRYSNTILEVSQSKGRRGAGMITLNSSHPDILKLINAKANQDKLNGVNISIKLYDSDINRIIRKKNFKYTVDWDIDIEEELDGGVDIIEDPGLNFEQPVLENLNAQLEVGRRGNQGMRYNREAKILTPSINKELLLDTIVKNATKFAEPGILFWDRILEQTDSVVYSRDSMLPVSTNPCGELPLPPYDSCRLASINVFAYVKDQFTENAEFDIDSFKRDVYYSQQIMDDVVELEIERLSNIINQLIEEKRSLFIFSTVTVGTFDVLQGEITMWKKIREMTINGRRTGLGMMGIADALAALNLKYDSPIGVGFVEEISKQFALSSYESSINMAKLRGRFPIHNLNKEIAFRKKVPFFDRILEGLEKGSYYSKFLLFGRRNIMNLAIAPTGTISMMAGVSSGIEPVFNLRYKRRRRALYKNKHTFEDAQSNLWEEFNVIHKPFLQWAKLNGIEEDLFEIDDKLFDKIVKHSPYYKSCTHEINPYNKILLQAAVQKWIDHSISITHNLPEHTKESEVKKLLLFAYEQNVKGFTVYVDKSRIGILVSKNDKSGLKDAHIKRPVTLPADIYITTVEGKKWIVIIGINNNKPYEIFTFKVGAININISKGYVKKIKGGFYSLLNDNKEVEIENIINEFETPEEEFGTRLISMALRHGTDLKFVYEQLSKSKGNITQFSKAISRILKKYIDNKNLSVKEASCPTCNSTNLSMRDGCVLCLDCGWSKCD